jgi:hypothetical protein
MATDSITFSVCDVITCCDDKVSFSWDIRGPDFDGFAVSCEHGNALMFNGQRERNFVLSLEHLACWSHDKKA